MTGPDGLLATLGPLATGGERVRKDFVRSLVNAWPDIAACLGRLAAAEADADRLAADLRELRRFRYAVVGLDAPPLEPNSALALHDARRSQP